jgi:hypothetical protein
MSDGGLKSTPLKRSINPSGAICAVLALGVAAALFYNEIPIGGVIAVAVAIGCGFLAAISGGKAACPQCGENIVGISSQGETRCPRCLSYAQPSGDRFRQCDPDAVSIYRGFHIPLPSRFQAPVLCCACGARATRTERIDQTLVQVQGRHAMMGTGMLQAFEAPHCGQHQGGASFGRETCLPGQHDALRASLKRIGILEAQDNNIHFTVLQVRSHRFYREFLALNRMNRA